MDLIVIDRPADRVARLTLNNPERRNAIDAELRSALLAAMADELANPDSRVIILTGSPKAFCAGGDLSSMQGLDAISGRARMKHGHRIVRMMATAEKPMIAAVEGWAVGAGAGLAVLCDTIVAGRSARFGFPFLRIGLIPDYGLPMTLAQRVGVPRARQLLFYSRTVTAETALAIGLADEVVDDDAVQRIALERACELAAQPANALTMTKRMLAQIPVSLETALEMEAMAQAVSFETADALEGRTAFLEKRQPKF